MVILLKLYKKYPNITQKGNNDREYKYPNNAISFSSIKKDPLLVFF